MSGVLNPYDSLSANVDVRWDVAGAHEGMVINPGITYFTPVSRGAGISLSLSAEHGDEAFNEYYYSVTPAQATASGLPVYDAGSGFNKLSANLLVGVDLDGDPVLPLRVRRLTGVLIREAEGCVRLCTLMI